MHCEYDCSADAPVVRDEPPGARFMGGPVGGGTPPMSVTALGLIRSVSSVSVR